MNQLKAYCFQHIIVDTKIFFSKRCQAWSDEEKIILLLQKLGSHENTKYTHFILPRKPEDISFKKTIEILSNIFQERDNLFYTRYRCLNILKQDETLSPMLGE